MIKPAPDPAGTSCGSNSSAAGSALRAAWSAVFSGWKAIACKSPLYFLFQNVVPLIRLLFLGRPVDQLNQPFSCYLFSYGDSSWSVFDICCLKLVLKLSTRMTLASPLGQTGYFFCLASAWRYFSTWGHVTSFLKMILNFWAGGSHAAASCFWAVPVGGWAGCHLPCAGKAILWGHMENQSLFSVCPQEHERAAEGFCDFFWLLSVPSGDLVPKKVPPVPGSWEMTARSMWYISLFSGLPHGTEMFLFQK